MCRRFLARADRILMLAHAVLWAAVMVVWVYSWDGEPNISGPTLNFARLFLLRIDGIVSGSIDHVSITIAAKLSSNVSLWYTFIFAGLMLVGGTLQWFLIGRLLQLVHSKYGRLHARLLTGIIAIWAMLAGVSWAMYWL